MIENDKIESEFPEMFELVLATAKKSSNHGIYVTLDEYDELPGFLHISEIATGWVKNVDRFVRVGDKKILKVIRIDKERSETDLSLRQVTGEERKLKLIEVKKSEKAKTILQMFKDKNNVSDEELEKITNILEEEFESVYTALAAIAKNGIEILKDKSIKNELQKKLDKISKEKIIIPEVQVKGVIELSTNDSDGIKVIKDIVKDSSKIKTPDARFNIKYLGAPRYGIKVYAEDYKTAEKSLKLIVQKIEGKFKSKGKFAFNKE